MKHWESVLYLVYISLWNYRFVVLAFYYVLYALIVYGYQLFNVVLSCLLLTAFNTHIRVMTNTLIRVLPVTLIWVLGHTLIWISSNNLYMVYHCLIILMLYILSFIAAMAWRFVSTFVVLFILTTPDLEHYQKSCVICFHIWFLLFHSGDYIFFLILLFDYFYHK